jgi:hypothetical protein
MVNDFPYDCVSQEHNPDTLSFAPELSAATTTAPTILRPGPGFTAASNSSDHAILEAFVKDTVCSAEEPFTQTSGWYSPTMDTNVKSHEHGVYLN